MPTEREREREGQQKMMRANINKPSKAGGKMRSGEGKRWKTGKQSHRATAIFVARL